MATTIDADTAHCIVIFAGLVAIVTAFPRDAPVLLLLLAILAWTAAYYTFAKYIVPESMRP